MTINEDLQDVRNKFVELVLEADWQSLPLGDYHRGYLQRITAAIDYYADIYATVLQRLSRLVDRPLSQLVVVDYGGGEGLMSSMAKMCGIGTVVYVDRSSDSIGTARQLHQLLRYGADVHLLGDELSLADYCHANHRLPDAIIGLDVIEHIYRLDTFFHHLAALNPAMPMLFTTASTPFNPYQCHKLHRYMHRAERDYLQLRRDYISLHQPLLSDAEVDRWARATRGLTYADIDRALRHDIALPKIDRHNTCDPANGNWMERILTASAYASLLQPYSLKLQIHGGLYNVHRGGLKGTLSRLLNRLIEATHSLRLAPFIVLEIGR